MPNVRRSGYEHISKIAGGFSRVKNIVLLLLLTAVYLFTKSPHSVLGRETSHFNIYSEETEAWDDKRRGSSQDINTYRITEEARKRSLQPSWNASGRESGAQCRKQTHHPWYKR